MGTLESVLLVGVLLALVFSGVHVAVSLGIVSLIGLALATGDLQITFFFLNSTAYEALRDYVFAVVPLFMLMGEFIFAIRYRGRHIPRDQPEADSGCPDGWRMRR